MSAIANPADRYTATLDQSVTRACQRIAPTWPLDQFIAVNPYWGYVNQPISEAAARLGSLSGAPLLMPRAFYLEHWKAGHLRREHLQGAIDAAGVSCTVDTLIASLYETPAPIPRLRLMTDLVDGHRDLQHAMAWRDFVTHQISQHCAAYFDHSQAAWNPDRRAGLYPSWLRQAADDHSPRLLMGFKGFGQKVSALPSDPKALIAAATEALGVPESGYDTYFTALLLSINGWASWCAYERWQAGLAQREDEQQIVHLLAIRLAWEWVLYQGEQRSLVEAQWTAGWRSHERLPSLAHAAHQHDWLLQQALERAYQEPLCQGLARATRPHQTATPAVQAVFCIDVRSEVFRRALEASSADIQTMGFAGFFGLPIAYNPLGTALTRPQLPGLLAPARCVTDECDTPAAGEAVAKRRQQALQWRQQWSDFRLTASSAFTFVESLGLLYAGKLLKNSLMPEAAPQPVEHFGLPAAQLQRLRPRLPGAADRVDPAEAKARCDLAAGVLGAMSLTQGFARLVLLAGHGSQSANNPYAAGLDCGACGGQTGEVNSRVLAALLNDATVRQGLQARGLVIPDSTCFLAGLHNTTTDELYLYDLDQLPASHAADLAQLQQWLAQAGARARAERAASLGLGEGAHPAAELERAIKGRATDWAQVRPEWGLANNAAFIVAPRTRSRHLNLAGRTFLHDYQWQQDTGLGTLELIMTAPMLVTNWINMQYYASTVDNPRYGSGNKVLHNVVGGRLGVFEGNGGDLRIGLPLQSLHDGEVLRHTPLRLSVFIEAPLANINTMIARHEIVRHLLDHEWLYLFQIGEDDGQTTITQYRGGCWETVATHPETA
jgi:uncharacterized protein YbcC (UPF0753/DUF2309 family)